MSIKSNFLHNENKNINWEEERKKYHEISSQILENVFIENISYLCHYVQNGDGIILFNSALDKISENRGAIVVGAGPSLDNDIETLKKEKENIFIISCDAALPVLAKHEITPNIIVITDHSKRQVGNFTGLDIRKSFVFIASVCHPLTFDEMRRAYGRPLWYNMADRGSTSLTSIARLVGKKGALIPGVLTSACAMQAAFWLGFKNVAFIGHDLSYPDNKGYSDDVSEEKKNFQQKTKLDSGDGLRQFKDINGNDITTHYIFTAFWFWINEHLEKIWSGTNIYNCSQQGILHGDRIQQTNLSNFIEKYGEEGYSNNCQEILNNIYLEDKRHLDFVIQPIFE